jgi:hypothetical protein
VSVTVQGTGAYGFLGLLSPWTAYPLTTVTIGTKFPLSWKYTDALGNPVASAAAAPQVRIKGPFVCGGYETSTTPQSVATSGIQYTASTKTWKYTWDTKLKKAGCYNVRIFTTETGQLHGPFPIKLRK